MGFVHPELFLTTALRTSPATAPAAAVGPIVGHVDDVRAVLWYRAAHPGPCTLRVSQEPGGWVNEHVVEALEENDLCVHWHVERLNPGCNYRYTVEAAGRIVADEPEQIFRTAPAAGQPARVTLAFGSCALEDERSREVWQRMAAEQVDGVVLLGDTPYIDKTDLFTQRRRHREFAAIPEFQALLRSRPFWGTWDDHDFGKNDADGLLPGKENVRRAFTEYRPQVAHGAGGQGIFQQFSAGPVDVFMLDTRWFARTDFSFADADKRTLLGQAQWDWLRNGLLTSAAPFKVLACGMIWDDKQNKESDDWGSYPHELDALKQFLLDHRIGGVVLVGGDIHVSRALKYDTVATVGYPLYQFISSPIHHKVLPSLNVPNPALLHTALEPNVFMTIAFDDVAMPPRLRAELIRRDGSRVFTVDVGLPELTPGAV